MKFDLLREASAIIIGFIVLWFAGAMFDFLPFIADDLSIRAIGFTGLLICVVLVICTCRIIREIRENTKEKGNKE